MSHPTVLKDAILLLEPLSMIGGIIVSTARQLGMPTVRQVNSIREAQHQLENEALSGFIISLEDENAALKLLYKLRAAEFAASPLLPVVVITSQCDKNLAEQLRAIEVRRILIKPFKVRDVILSIELLSSVTSD